MLSDKDAAVVLIRPALLPIGGCGRGVRPVQHPQRRHVRSKRLDGRRRVCCNRNRGRPACEHKAVFLAQTICPCRPSPRTAQTPHLHSAAAAQPARAAARWPRQGTPGCRGWRSRGLARAALGRRRPPCRRGAPARGSGGRAAGSRQSEPRSWAAPLAVPGRGCPTSGSRGSPSPRRAGPGTRRPARRRAGRRPSCPAPCPTTAAPPSQRSSQSRRRCGCLQAEVR